MRAGLRAGLTANKLVYSSLRPYLADGKYFVSPQKKTRRGRPLQITDSALESNRDHQHGNFDNGWGEVGWELSRAKTIESLRKALEPLRDRPELALFVNEPKTPSTWKELREGRKDINQLLNRLRIAYQEVSSAWERLEKSRAALPGSGFDKLLKRMCEEREEDYSKALEYLQLLQKLLDERTGEQRSRESYISQSELLEFIISKRHKLTPLSISNAIAGLPFITCRQSTARCTKIPGAQGLRYSMLQELTRALANSPHAATEAVEQVKDYLLRIKGNENAVRKLRREWYYLRTAIEAVYSAKLPRGSLPFRVLAEYCRRSSTPSRYDQVMEEEVRL